MPSNVYRGFAPVLFMAMFASICVGQQITSSSASASVSVPRLVNFSGVLTDADGKPLNGVTGVTFLLYQEQSGGVPLWMETQNILPTTNGHYVATLGITVAEGLPADIFASTEARWLAVQVIGQPEPARVALVAVPYALKAADAETIGGLPPSAFVLAAPASVTFNGDVGNSSPVTSSEPSVLPATAITGSGTADFVPLWNSASTLDSSVLFQSGAGATARIGINTSTPFATLDVNGAGTFRGLLTLPPITPAKPAAGSISQSLNLTAAAYNSSTKASVNQTFRWQAEPVANNTATPNGTLDLLYASGTGAPVETGLKIGGNGNVTFSAGQSFPGTGTGTVSSVAAGLGLKGGPITGSGTLSIDSAVVPLLSSPNIFTANQTVNGNLFVNGLFGTGVTLTGSAPTFMGAGSNPNEGGSGNSLTVSGGSAAIAASNAPGGDLILAAGNGNGLGGGGNVRLQAASSGPTGTAADSLVDRQFIAAAPVNMGGPSGLSSEFLLNIADFTSGAIVVRFTITAIGQSSQGVATGSCLFAGVTSPAGVTTIEWLFGADEIDAYGYVNPACISVRGNGLSGVAVADSVSFDPTIVHTMYYQIENISGLPLIIQPQTPNSSDRVVTEASQRVDALHPRATLIIHR
jgi:hypothetical protein